MNALEHPRLPNFTFNWPDACSPHASAVEEQVIQWVDKYKLVTDSRLCTRTLRARHGGLVARCYPTVSFDLLTTIADYIAWLFWVGALFFDRVQTLSSRTAAPITAIIDVLDLNTVQCAEVEQLEERTNTAVSLSNDIYSLAMELEQPGQNVNRVTPLAGPSQALPQGVDLAAKSVQTELDHFTQLSEHLLSHAFLPLKRYIQGLRPWLSGHQRWVESDTSRYSTAFSHSDADQRPVACERQCADAEAAC